MAWEPRGNLRGPQGPQGLRGPQGLQGPKGDPGDPATNLITSVFGRTGAVVAQSGDYSVGQVTGAVPNTLTLTAGNGLTGGGNLTQGRAFQLGVPGTITGSTANAVQATSHTHALSANLKAWDGIQPASKADDNNVVHRSGAESIAGTKTFTHQVEAEGGVRTPYRFLVEGSTPTGLVLNRTSANINSNIEARTTAGSVFFGQGSPNRFDVGGAANLRGTDSWASIGQDRTIITGTMWDALNINSSYSTGDGAAAIKFENGSNVRYFGMGNQGDLRTSTTTGFSGGEKIFTSGNLLDIGTTAASARSALSLTSAATTAAYSGGVANSLALRDGNGDIHARLFRMNFGNNNSSPVNFVTVNQPDGGDNYLRPSSVSSVKATLGVNNVRNEDFQNYGLGGGGAVSGTYDGSFGTSTAGGRFFYHSTGSAPSDSPTGSQTAGIHIGTPWGRAQIALPNSGSEMYFRTGTSTAWNEVWHSNRAVVSNGAQIGAGDTGKVRITAPGGWVDIGPHNSSRCHFYTSVPTFYFDKTVDFNGEIRFYGGPRVPRQFIQSANPGSAASENDLWGW